MNEEKRSWAEAKSGLIQELKEDWVELSLFAGFVGDTLEADEFRFGTKEDEELKKLTKKMAKELLEETEAQVGTLENGGAPFRVYDDFPRRVFQLIDRYWNLGGGFHAPEETIWFTIPAEKETK